MLIVAANPRRDKVMNKLLRVERFNYFWTSRQHMWLVLCRKRLVDRADLHQIERPPLPVKLLLRCSALTVGFVSFAELGEWRLSGSVKSKPIGCCGSAAAGRGSQLCEAAVQVEP